MMHDYDQGSFTRDRERYSRDQASDRNRGSAFSWRGDNERGDYQRSGYGRGGEDWRDRNRGSSSSESRSRSDEFGRGNERDLIASDRVEGTTVYDRNGDKLGSIHNFMVEKRGGRVAYAVMKCSDGFLGMDERYYPLSWNELDYDERLDGYRVSMTEHDLDQRRSYDSQGRPTRSSDERYRDNR